MKNADTLDSDYFCGVPFSVLWDSVEYANYREDVEKNVNAAKDSQAYLDTLLCNNHHG